MKRVKNILASCLLLAVTMMINACGGDNTNTTTPSTVDTTTSIVDNPAFITTWNTQNSGYTASNAILISTANDATHFFTIDWGDGIVDANIAGDNIHAYATTGIYTVTITGDFPRIYFNGANYDAAKLLSVEQWGDVNWTTMSQAFYECSNLVINATDVPNLANVTDMSFMFYNATALNSDLSDWNTSAVIDMSFMFNYSTAFNGDLSAWNTSAVTNMSFMFNNATAFTNHDLSPWSVTNVGTNHLEFLTGAGVGNTEPSWVTEVPITR